MEPKKKKKNIKGLRRSRKLENPFGTNLFSTLPLSDLRKVSLENDTPLCCHYLIAHQVNALEPKGNQLSNKNVLT